MENKNPQIKDDSVQSKESDIKKYLEQQKKRKKEIEEQKKKKMNKENETHQVDNDPKLENKIEPSDSPKLEPTQNIKIGSFNKLFVSTIQQNNEEMRLKLNDLRNTIRNLESRISDKEFEYNKLNLENRELRLQMEKLLGRIDFYEEKNDNNFKSKYIKMLENFNDEKKKCMQLIETNRRSSEKHQVEIANHKQVKIKKVIKKLF